MIREEVPTTTIEGNPPVADPIYGRLVADAWHGTDEHHVKSRTDVERYFRLSWSGKCARDLGYLLANKPYSDPPDEAAVWRMGLGTMVHEAFEGLLPGVFPYAEVETPISQRYDETFGFPVSGRSDVFIPNDDDHGTRIDGGTLISLKSVNGFGFKKMIGARGAAEGPKTAALMQVAMEAKALRPDRVVILYLSLECLSDRELAQLAAKGGDAVPLRKYVAEWHYSYDEIIDIADRETARVGKVFEMVEAGELPPRSIPLEMPPGARITDVDKGAWTLERGGAILDAGETWWCKGCWYRTKCKADGAS